MQQLLKHEESKWQTNISQIKLEKEASSKKYEVQIAELKTLAT